MTGDNAGLAPKSADFAKNPNHPQEEIAPLLMIGYGPLGLRHCDDRCFYRRQSRIARNPMHP